MLRRQARLGLLALVVGTLVGCAPRDVRLGRRAMAEGDFVRAAERFAQAAADAPDKGSRWLELARAELMADRPERARVAFARLAALRPRDPRPVVEIAFTHELQRDYDAALRAYGRAIEIAPESAYAHRVLGTRLLRWNQADAAVAPLERACELAPEHAETWKALGLARHQVGDLEGAEAAFRDGLRHRPGTRTLQLPLAALLINARRLEDALAIYDAVLENDPRFAPAHVGRGILLHELGRPDEAEAAFVRAMEVAEDPRPYHARLVAYRRLRATPGARSSESNHPAASRRAPPTDVAVGEEPPSGSPTANETSAETMPEGASTETAPAVPTSAATASE
ncbi:MAG: tetratricopeptide repeat protein [Sandaracinus sp.]|nr:tetratricopeptide repeat protein [Sandaracinus sp.]MCB9634932.1 tetratricopeptide repeat protein [Sandaracinus sp.]